VCCHSCHSVVCQGTCSPYLCKLGEVQCTMQKWYCQVMYGSGLLPRSWFTWHLMISMVHCVVQGGSNHTHASMATLKRGRFKQPTTHHAAAGGCRSIDDGLLKHGPSPMTQHQTSSND
jgi:hypothetical protein